MLAAAGSVVADDVADDADIVGVPGGDAALGVVSDEIAFDQVMPADEDVLVLGFGGDQRLGVPGFAAAVDAFAGGVAHDVVADDPVIAQCGC